MVIVTAAYLSLIEARDHDVEVGLINRKRSLVKVRGFVSLTQKLKHATKFLLFCSRKLQASNLGSLRDGRLIKVFRIATGFRCFPVLQNKTISKSRSHILSTCEFTSCKVLTILSRFKTAVKATVLAL